MIIYDKKEYKNRVRITFVSYQFTSHDSYNKEYSTVITSKVPLNILTENKSHFCEL